MNLITPPLVGSIRNLLDSQSLRLFENSSWGADTLDHRSLMREFLAKHLDASESDFKTSILDLNLPATKIGSKFCSITHATDKGLIAIDQNPIGIDLEVSARVNEKTVRRIASDKEVSRMPNSSALWCAKESAFKALRSFQQPTTMSQLEIGGWRESQYELLFFELKNVEDFLAPQGRGALIQSDIWSLAIFIFSS